MGVKLELSPTLRYGLSFWRNVKYIPVGLKFVSNSDKELDKHIKLHLIEAKKYGAQAVYFRFFENRPPIPQIYIYESNINVNILHKKLWSSW